MVVDDVPASSPSGSSRRSTPTARRFSFALSGGDPARRCYERLADDAGTQIDWWKVDVYWGDERCVSHDHPDSNYRLAREALLDRVGAANATHLMRCAEGRPVPAAARRPGPHRPDPPRHGSRRPHRVAVPESPALDADPGRLVAMNHDPSGSHPHTRMTLTLAASPGPAWRS